MRIISDRKDYYDCVQHVGQDRTNVYVRKEEEVKLGRKEWPFPFFCPYVSGICKMYIIGFCGNIYPMLEIEGPYKCRGGRSTVASRDKATICFNIEDVDAVMNLNLKPKELKVYIGDKSFWHSWISPRKDFVKFFYECNQVKGSFMKMFTEKRCPIFVAYSPGRWIRQDHTIVYNPLLKPFGFVRLFDPYVAFQEIAMFMANQAIPQDPMPVIPDDMKILTHGFNKWSFRTPPKEK